MKNSKTFAAFGEAFYPECTSCHVLFNFPPPISISHANLPLISMPIKACSHLFMSTLKACCHLWMSIKACFHFNNISLFSVRESVTRLVSMWGEENICGYHIFYFTVSCFMADMAIYGRTVGMNVMSTSP